MMNLHTYVCMLCECRIHIPFPYLMELKLKLSLLNPFFKNSVYVSFLVSAVRIEVIVV